MRERSSGNINDIHPHIFFAEQDYISPKHWQKEVEGIYVEKGWLNVWADNKIFFVNEGEILFISPGAIHSYLNKKDDSIIEIIKFLPEHIYNEAFTEENKRKIRKLFSNIFMVQKNGKLNKIINEITTYEENELSECFIAAKVLELTVFLLKMKELLFNTTQVITNEKTQYLDEIFLYIEDHYREQISLHMMAEHIGITDTYCSRYIKKRTGLTFTDYLSGVRIGKAEELLLKTKKTVTEIVYETGFGSVQTFNRVFKKKKSLTPSEYRKYKIHKK